MVKYTCGNCNKTFSQKGHYEDHLKRKNPCKPIIEPKIIPNLSTEQLDSDIKFLSKNVNDLIDNSNNKFFILTEKMKKSDETIKKLQRLWKIVENLQNIAEEGNKFDSCLVINEQKNECSIIPKTKINGYTQNENLKLYKLIPILEKEKQKKHKIPIPLKANVWNYYIGREKGMSKCFCCVLRDIEKDSFDCGHVISEKNGGQLTLENLRPICGSCNSSMESMNMDLFIKSHGLSNVLFSDSFKLNQNNQGMNESEDEMPKKKVKPTKYIVNKNIK